MIEGTTVDVNDRRAYHPLDAAAAARYAATCAPLCDAAAAGATLTAREVGDGNLNLVFIVEGPAVYEWTADSSQPLIGSGTATYRISAPCSACSIPSGAMFIVRVYDVLSQTYSFSPTLRA